MNILVISFFFFQVHSATIPVNVGQNEGGLQDLSSRLYLAEHPYFENTIVGATMKKNLKKLCEQCKHSPLCRGKDECEHCAKYCEAYGAEMKGNMVASSMGEEVGIAREPENDFMRNEREKDTTLVSRFADDGMMSNGMAAGMEQEEQVQMVHNPMAEEMGEEMVMENHPEHEGQTEGILKMNHQESRYYTAGVIKPGLLMNIMLKLINIKQTNDIEKAIILVKSKKSVPVTVGMGEETEFLKMLGKELETTEKIHGKSPLDSKDINKILETAYEKGEFKSKSEAQIVSEADTIPMVHNEKITRFDDKIVSSPNEMELSTERFEPPAETLEKLMDEAKLDEGMEASRAMLRETNMKHKNDDQSYSNMMVSQSIPQEMSVVGSSKTEALKNSNMKRQDILMESDMKENMGTTQERERENSMDMDSASDESVEENDKARTLHHKKYKKKKKKGHFHSYGHSYGSNYNEPYGYYRSNDDQSTNHAHQVTLQMNNQGTMETLTGAQQENQRPQNEDRIGAKNDWQRDQKGFLFKGEGDLEKSQKSINDENLIGAQQENVRPFNEDLISIKDDWQRDQKGFTFKGEGGLFKGPEKSQKTRNNEDFVDAQQEGLSPVNKDTTVAKDDWRNAQKGFIDKGQEDLLEDQARSQKTRNGETLTQKENENLDDETIDVKEDSDKNSERMADEGIAKIHISEKNKKLDPKKVQIAEPYVDTHDGMPDPFHTRIHAHFNKVQDYFKQKSGKSKGNSGTIVAATADFTNKENINGDDVMIQTRHNEEASDGQDANQQNIKTDNLQMTNSLKTKEETLSKHELPDMNKEPINDMPNIGIDFQPEDLINLQMAKEKIMEEEPMPKVGINIQPQDIIILQKTKEHGNREGSMDLARTDMESPTVKAASPINNIFVTDDLNDLENPTNRPQFVGGDENLPGQTVIQVDDQLIDVPDEGASIFQVNSQPVIAVSNENDQEQQNIFINQPETGDNGDNALAENVGATHMIPSENLRVNPQVMKDQSGQNLGLSGDMFIVKSESPRLNHPISPKIPSSPSYSFKKEEEFRGPKIVYTGNEDMVRSSETGKPGISHVEPEFPTAKTAPMKEHPFAPVFEGLRAAKIIQTGEQGSERSSATEKLEEIEEMSSTESMMKVVGNERSETVGGRHMEYENEIEKKIDKLITPREQEFLHNFGKIVPSIEKMHLNSKSDIFFMGNGIKLPLKMSPNKDGSISLSVDLEKLCKCKNSTCAHKMDMINRLDENLMDLSDNHENSEVSPIKKHENDIPYIEDYTEKKIRKPRNHVDLSKLYKTYRKRYHKLHRRSVSNEYFRRFKEIEQGLEKKLDELNENVKKSNREYDNMLRKGTQDLLQIKDEDQVVKQRIELVNDLLKWMKEMASEVKNIDDKNNENVGV